jgi:Ca2+-binding RTX toxin-like protein
VDNKAGNGGVHFYLRNGLSREMPSSPAEAFEAYARTPSGEKAIYRAPIRTQPRGTVCTAHVFQQIPGQNRIFMGWYSQGTQVIDFVEDKNGAVRFAEAGFFIPAHANEWVSHIFKVQRNANGSYTYWGATGDFNLGEAGRNAIDVYKVTLPPAPLPAGVRNPLAGASRSGACGLRINGTPRSETLRGSIDGDLIRAAGGRDRLIGRAGVDCLHGGLGGDVVRAAGGGRDRVYCGPGRDRALIDSRDRTRGCEIVRRR